MPTWPLMLSDCIQVMLPNGQRLSLLVNEVVDSILKKSPYPDAAHSASGCVRHLPDLDKEHNMSDDGKLKGMSAVLTEIETAGSYIEVLRAADAAVAAAKAKAGLVREVGKLLNITTERKPRKRKPKTPSSTAASTTTEVTAPEN